jgi:inner membrane protein
MPTIFSHPAVAMLKTWFPRVPRRAIPIGVVATILPDVDVTAFAYGIPYRAMFGHRGFTHSIVFALLVAAAGTSFLKLKTGRGTVLIFLFLCAVSHTLLDAMTSGGLGVAFFSPFSNERYFFPWRPIRVSPIGVDFFGEAGVAVLRSELIWVWVPSALLGIAGWLIGLARPLPSAPE